MDMEQIALNSIISRLSDKYMRAVPKGLSFDHL